MKSITLSLFSLLAFVGTSHAQADLLNDIRVQVVREAKIKAYAEVDARVLDDFYIDSQLVVPKGTKVIGKVVSVTPVSRHTRLSAISHGDFTPLRTPEIQFTELHLGDGRDIPLDADIASEASETVRFTATGSKRSSLIRRAWADLMGRKNEAVRTITAPGKRDRAEEYLYSQLPWHPQEIENGTVYDVHLRHSLELEPTTHLRVSKAQTTSQNAALQARLTVPLDSKSTKKGDSVAAIVTAPQFDAEHQILIPEGSLLIGRVVNVSPARRFGRNGTLRFNFDRLQLPEGYQQDVNGVATAIDGSHGQQLAIDAEGGVQRPSNKGVIAPLVLTLLSASALHEDESPVAHAAVASNGFGLATRIVSMTTKSSVFGGVVGGIAAARMVYSRFIAHGKDVKFDRGTGIEVDLGATHAPMSKPASSN